ncbi:MAG TPA: sigma-70 family RNA polymerase sigma factor [Anaerolineae bacterium]|nr:sigma-70 family RNA polymerase sigma factor [Anaerolineae bacterium]HID85721.1 sigma-70 family RNA polymerase sigma factor [Anaerolineales bacterium]HIQ09488.1 sigma-70 family RNA polymerase sigma factor [Anaerolineaceae bacterium]
MRLPNEPDLLTAARRGDLEAFNRLVLAYQEEVYALAYRMLGDPEAAADATQEAFLSAWRHLKGFRGGSFRGWLLRIATNACYDELRRRGRRPQVPLEGTDEETEADALPWMTDPNPASSPETMLQRREVQQALETCIRRLPPKLRTVLLLVDVHGLDYAQAAASLDVPLGTVKSRLARARRAMRDCLGAFAELLPALYRPKDDEHHA